MPNRLERFIGRHAHAGIRNLMLYIVVANAVVLVLMQVQQGLIFVDQLYFVPARILEGQVWRLVTFIFIPSNDDLIFGAISLFFYYWIGSSLEREWGTLKFNLFYLAGVLATMLSMLIVGLLVPSGLEMGTSAAYINLSLFFAFAILYPDMQVRLFFILPVKIKYLAFIELAFFVFSVIASPFPLKLLPIVALFPVAFFFYKDFFGAIARRRRNTKNTVNFKKKARDIQSERGYLHKCTVCGKTDTENPETEFRYCSHCKGYACYCEAHIFEHEHIQ